MSRRSLTVSRNTWLPSSLLSLAAAAALMAPGAALPDWAISASAQENVEPQVPKELTDTVTRFWHYGRIGNYDIAVAEGQKLLDMNAEPRVVLNAFEAIGQDRNASVDEWLVRWQRVDNKAMNDVAAKVVEVLNKGRFNRRGDPAYIERNIQRLIVNELAYRNAISELRDSGELAVPLMVQYLRDPNRSEYHDRIRRALQDMGRLGLNPLLAATEMTDAAVLPNILTVLGDLGYDAALPYLARISESAGSQSAIQTAANRAMERISGGGSKDSAATRFARLAEELYYDRSAIAADPRAESAYIWYWSENTGLTKKDVPPRTFNEIMAMRAAEYALKLGEDAAPLSLWLAANYKREAESPDGTAPTADGQPDAHYYGVTSGVDYLYAALERSMNDRDSAVVLKIIRSLQDIVGESSLRGGESPLVEALNYPDRRVRFEAAFALAGALPSQSFSGQEQVVPIMSEALAQTGKPTIILLLPSADAVSQQVEPLTSEGFVVRGASTVTQVRQVLQELPAVDVIAFSDELPQAEIDAIRSLISSSPKLSAATQVVKVRSGQSEWETEARTNPLLSTTQVIDKESILRARESAGALPLDAEIAADYSLRAAELLREVAVNAGDVYELNSGKDSLLTALGDDRETVTVLAGEVSAYLNVPEAQSALLRRAEETSLPVEVRVSLYKALAMNAKFFGRKLEGNDLTALEKTVSSAENLEIRSAAAEARGALNLPVQQAEQLVVDQSKV